jgi:PAS domain-containing protein
VPHVELSLTDTPAGLRPRRVRGSDSSVDRWAMAAADAGEPCLVLDVHTTIVAASPSCARMIGLGEPAAVVGRRLREAIGPLVDFTAARSRLQEPEVDRIPPLLAVSSGLLARGLIRVESHPGRTTTLDAISTPLRDGPTVVGSLTFFARV